MSNPDSFIDEVTDAVRRDKLFATFRRYGWIAILAVVLIVGGAAFNEWQKARAATTARGFGDALLAALELPDAAARTDALAAIRAEGGRAAVLQFLTAADAVNTKNKPAALATLEALAQDASLSQSYRDLAGLKQVMLAGADMPAADRLAVLQQIATPGRAFRPLALEQAAMVRLETGDKDQAVAELRAVLQEPLISEGLRTRVTQVMVALGVDPAAE